MKLRSSVRTLGLAFALAGGLMATPASAQHVPELFDGAGYGATAETAVRQAIGDAEVTASSYQLYNCELVGEPEVFPQPPGSLRAFRAHVTMRCR